MMSGVLFALAVPAASWPQFRGVSASGLDESKPLPTSWRVDDNSGVLWQAEVPGLGHASPIIWKDRVYLVTAVKPGKSELRTGLYGDIQPLDEKESHQWRLLAFDRRNGSLEWDMLGWESVPKVKRHPKASHANCTPATDGKVIAAIFGSEGLFCFDMAGKLLWKKDLGPMDSGFFSVPSAQWGFASSPVIAEGKIVVLCDVQTNSFIAAFDATDGKEIWRTPRHDVPTWGTPTVFSTPTGEKQIAVNGWHESAGYSWSTGRRIWHLDGGGDIPVPTPIYANGLLYLTSAHGRFRPVRAINAEARGDITPADPGQTNQFIVWAHARQGNYMQTPIVVSNLLFACYDNGLLTCFDAKTGAIHFSERLSSAGKGFTSSPVSDGRHVYFASEPGTVYVVPVSPKFSISATNELGEACMATPAILDGTLFYRTRSKLIAIGPKRE